MKNIKRILIVRTDRIGDVVLTTPVFKALRESFPDAFIAALVTPYTKSLIDKNPYLNEVLIDDRLGTHKGLFGFIQLIDEIKKHEFDCALVFHTKKRTNLLCYLSRIPRRIGYKNEKFGFFLTQPITDQRHLGDKHEAQYCLDLLKAIDIQGDEISFHVSVHDDDEQWADVLIHRNDNEKIVCIHPGASDPSKQWPAKYFGELLKKLNNQYSARFVIVGSANLKGISQEIITESKVDCINLIGKTSISQMVSLFKRSHLLISNDSGPVHVAAALNVPVISIFTRNQPGINAQRWRPLGKKARYISVLPDQNHSFKKAATHDSKYLELIKPQGVLEEVDALFKLC